MHHCKNIIEYLHAQNVSDSSEFEHLYIFVWSDSKLVHNYMV